MIENKKLNNADIIVYHYVHSGQVGGKLKDASNTYVTSGKNIGKANETNIFIQAMRDANTLYEKQLKVSSTDEVMLSPMLAKNSKEIKSLPSIAYVQPKLDGVRAMAYHNGKELILFSRNMKRYHIHFDLVLESNIYLDGELYLHGSLLQDINSYASRSMKDFIEDNPLQYHVFDMYDTNKPDLTFEERYNILKKIPLGANIVLVQTTKTKEPYDAIYKKYLDMKYEGIMLRVPESPYLLGKNGARSSGLIKMKPTYDAEFEVIDIAINTKGKTSDTFMFVCITDNGYKFDVTPAMTIAERRKLADVARDIYVGQKITVSYDELSKDGVPLRGRSVGVIRTDI